ncbi:putative bifunctional diguanylate cyclase/phosphodiesterase [Pseudokineococcus lusitanus]|uniref:Diguanylate cyclase (GGDEF)-like protein n=1 Tax=Pseudokineococcus lusitanus TaxID=763993 RepID=A0A3N1HQ95_9ACTN|nr:EAL domain-containing protein [Pseudokineococcus lusitanus]ROP44552.1 diguanylate cyclase (GGDEF)-like protein [Pseudokineococcus lusitanus]
MAGPAADVGSSRRARRPPRSPRASIWMLTAVLAVVGAVLAVVALLPERPEPEIGWPLPVMVVLFLVGERVVARLPSVEGAHTFTFREVPAVIGLAYLNPLEYLLAYVVGGTVAAVASGQRGPKLAFNTALFVVEAGAGVLVYELVRQGADVAEPQAWLASFLAVMGTEVVAAVAVTGAIAVSEGRPPTFGVPEWARTGLLAAVINTAAAVLVVVLIEARPLALLVLVVVLAAVGVGYRHYISLVDGYTRVQALYRFVGSTGTSAELPEALSSVLREASGLLRTERAELVVLRGAEDLGDDWRLGTALSLRRGGELERRQVGPDEVARAWWAPAVTGTPVVLGAGHPSPVAGAPRDGIAVHLVSETYRAVFLVTDRHLGNEDLGEQDLQLFETLSAHAAVTLERARLVDRLRRVAAEREHDALHDALTGLPNRRAFNEAVARALADDRGGAVLLMDLDDFKDVNDTLGHRAGDELLQVTGRRLRDSVAASSAAGDGCPPGTVARLGGDEFAVLLPGVSAAEAFRRARGLLTTVVAPVPMQDLTLTTTASFGVAPIPPGARDTDELLVHADVAMYAAKSTGSGVATYVPEDTDAVHRRLALAGELPTAIERRGFEVWCQPQTDARTGVVTGVEALLRWWHPGYGWVPPAEVVAIAERTGHLGRLTLAVLQESLRLRASWAAEGHELDVSVNVTARDISDLTLPDSVAALLAATGTPPSALVLEITESGVMSDPERSLEVLSALSRLGVGVSVDDFGTGHSSLAYLERLPVDEVKIDQSFVRRLEREATDSTVVRSIVLLAHDLGMRVVAEGVESEVARQRVQALGCEVVQGFVVARPMPGDQVPGWLARRRTATATS